MSANAFQNISKIEDSLWEAADQLRANSKLTGSECSNKHRIGNMAPRAYIGKFEKDTKELGETPKTHLIKDMDAYGVKADDYDGFIRRRAREIALGLNMKLVAMTPAKAAEAEKAA